MGSEGWSLLLWFNCRSIQELSGPSLPEDLGKDAGGSREHDDQLKRGRRGQGSCQQRDLLLHHGVRLNRLSGCSKLSADPGWQNVLASQLWPRFGTRVPLQRGVEQGHLDDAGVREDGDAGQEVDRARGFRVRRRAGRTYWMARWHALVLDYCSVQFGKKKHNAQNKSVAEMDKPFCPIFTTP